MTASGRIEELYVFVTVADQRMAVPVSWVREMVPLPRVVGVPNSPAFVQGVINLRGRVMPLIDLRTRLGYLSCAQERRDQKRMLEQRRADHIAWLKELEASINEERPFKLATDPHKCAFGKWYYVDRHQEASSGCMIMEGLLAKFEKPHNRIHGLAEEVLALAREGQHREALDRIEETRQTTLATLLQLFDQVLAEIDDAARELAMVLDGGKGSVAVSVDGVEMVEAMPEDRVEAAGGIRMGLEDGLVSGVGRRLKDELMVMVLDPRMLIEAGRGIAG